MFIVFIKKNTVINNKLELLRSEIDTLMSEDPKINNYVIELSQVNVLRELKNKINQIVNG